MLRIDYSGPGWWQLPEDSRLTWREPKPGDLIFDARDFYKKAKIATKRAVQARYGRASLLLSISAVEAISNDTLTSIYALLMDSCPSECRKLEPWVWFMKFSHRPVERLLLRRGSLARKIQYILRHLRRMGRIHDNELEQHLKETVQARNRIVHMTYLLNPKNYPSVLNPRQILHAAKTAIAAAEEYIATIGDTFEEIHLPVATAYVDNIRPDWWSDDDWARGSLSARVLAHWFSGPLSLLR
jgi:hypothetical protein